MAETSINAQTFTLVLPYILVIYFDFLAFPTLSTDEWPCATKLLYKSRKENLTCDSSEIVDNHKYFFFNLTKPNF